MCVQGIHDIHPNGTIPGQSGSPAVYAAQLANITVQLQQMEPQAKLLFAVTSPIMCQAKSDAMVVELNKHAVRYHDSIIVQISHTTRRVHAATHGITSLCNRLSTFNLLV